MKDCVFCKIVRREISAEVEKETSNLLVFKDIKPRAPFHLLLVPKEHIEDVRGDSGVLWASIGKLAVKIAHEKGLMGFRLVHNAGTSAAVKHMHVHLLGDISVDREV